MMSQAFQTAKMTMEEAKPRAKAYHDSKAEHREFVTGQRVLVFWPNVLVGVNQKFYNRWKPYLVVKPVGQVNLMVQAEGPPSKPIVVHVDRVVRRRAMDDPAEEFQPALSEAACAALQAWQSEADETLAHSRKKDEEMNEEEWIWIIRANDELEPRRVVGDRSPVHLDANDPRALDPWYQLGNLIFGKRHKRSQGPVPNLPLPPKCLTSKRGRTSQ